MNKCDLLDDAGRSQLHAFLKRANPKAKLDAATEEALVKQYPQPELLLPKVEPRSKEERAARFGKKKKRGKKGRA